MSRSATFHAILASALLLPAAATLTCTAQQSGSNSAPTTRQPNSDYGAGGYAATQNDSAGAELHGTVYDSGNNLRHDETNTYTSDGGAEHKTEQHGYNYGVGGHLELGWDFKYDLRGGLSYSDVTHYGLHGERTAEEITHYRADGYEIRDWSLGAHQWYTDFTPYKTPLPAAPAAQAPANNSLGVLFPRSYLPGETVTGSLWPSSYAEKFTSVPGLSEYTFPVQLDHLPDGSPEWGNLQIGVKGDGYVPVNPNGTFSLHIPYDWKGPLQLEVRQPDPVAGAGPAQSLLNIDPPASAPSIPAKQFSPAAQTHLMGYTQHHLVTLWEDACDLEDTLDELNSEPTPDWARIYAVEDELDDVYDEIDAVEDTIPPGEVIQLAQDMHDEAVSYHDWLEKQPDLDADDKADLEDTEDWTGFLYEEIGYMKYGSGDGFIRPAETPFWTNPVINQGKLNVIGGSFPIDPYLTHMHVDQFGLTPLAATPSSWYFMPPTGLTTGAHNLLIDGPLFPETIFPTFTMKLTMTADQLSLHRGQSTTYHVSLDGLNGLPGGAWGGSSDPTDLIGASELSAAQNAAGTTRKGYITLAITNQSPAVITMENQFRTLDASFFAPSGSYKVDGGVGAIMDGTFVILGVARAYLQPEIGAGVPPGSSLSGGSDDAGPGAPGSWFPGFSLNYDPNAFSNSSFMTQCPGAGAAPIPTGGQAPAAPCIDSVINDLLPQKSVPQVNQVQDNSTDLTQLPAAHKRVEEARKTEQEQRKKMQGAQRAEGQTWSDGIQDVPKELLDALNQAQQKAVDARVTRDKYKAANEEKKTDQSEFLYAAAEQDYQEADRAARAAEQDVIDHFKPEKRKAYEDAEAAVERTINAWCAAENERRAAEAALNKLVQTAGLK